MAVTVLARRPQDAATWPELEQYFATRARQLWHEGWRWSQKLDDVGVGCRTEFTSATGELFASFYVLAQHHGQGHFKQLVGSEPLPIITITDCHIEQILDHIGARYVRAGDLLDCAEYRLVEAVLADSRSSSGAFRMNLVDEGLAVLADLGASMDTKRAFCLFPLVSEDNELAKYYHSLEQVLAPIPGGLEALALAVESREIACRWRPGMPNPQSSVQVSSSKNVKDLLIAEKVQQRAALTQHAMEDSSKADLNVHYQSWLEALGAADRYLWLRSRLPTF